jgi:hypothetical protein
MERKAEIMICFLIITGLCSCGNYLTHSVYYKKAIFELTFHDYKENYSIIASKEIYKKSYLIYHFDTLHLTVDKKNLAFRNKVSKNIFFYQFYRDEHYKRIKCDSLWNVTELSESFGAVY